VSVSVSVGVSVGFVVCAALVSPKVRVCVCASVGNVLCRYHGTLWI